MRIQQFALYLTTFINYLSSILKMTLNPLNLLQAVRNKYHGCGLDKARRRVLVIVYTCFEKGCRMKASSQCVKIEWWSGHSLPGIWMSMERKTTNLCFCTWSTSEDKLDFPLIRPFFCSFSFTVTWLLVENSSKIQVAKRVTSLKEKKTYELMFAILRKFLHIAELITKVDI